MLHFAKAQGRQVELADRLFTAFFAEGRHLGSDDVLADLAADVGLDRNAALAALESGVFLAEVNDDIAQARGAGITSVPSYLFNESHVLSGVQPPETFTSVLNRLYAWELDDS